MSKAVIVVFDRGACVNHMEAGKSAPCQDVRKARTMAIFVSDMEEVNAAPLKGAPMWLNPEACAKRTVGAHVANLKVVLNHRKVAGFVERTEVGNVVLRKGVRKELNVAIIVPRMEVFGIVTCQVVHESTVVVATVTCIGKSICVTPEDAKNLVEPKDFVPCIYVNGEKKAETWTISSAPP